MAVLNKDELITIYAEQYEVTKKDGKEQLEGIFEFFEGILTDYQSGFRFGEVGTFDVVTNPEKSYRNPQTGEMGDPVPEHLGFKFKPSKGKTSVRVKLKNTKI